jgi:hypothetical protein
VKALLGRLFLWRTGTRWYLFAVGYIIAIKLAVALAHRTRGLNEGSPATQQ